MLCPAITDTERIPHLVPVLSTHDTDTDSEE